jgi:hypothetical protein
MRTAKKIGGLLFVAWSAVRFIPDLLESIQATGKYTKWLLQHLAFPHSLLLTVIIFVVGMGLTFSDTIQQRIQQLYRQDKPHTGPFAVIQFPVSDLMSSQIRTDYICVKNIGDRPALDVEIEDLVKQWGKTTYKAVFPSKQILESGQAEPVTPTVYRDDEHHPIFSINSRVWFCSLLVGDDENIEYGKEHRYNVRISYTDRGERHQSMMTIVAKYQISVLVSVEDQRLA